jgi:hypothetical protein
MFRPFSVSMCLVIEELKFMKPEHSPSILPFFSKCAAAAILALILGTTAFAQVDRAELEGTVADPSGVAVVGASVKILAVDTDLTQEQRTNSSGYYRFPGLAVGRYKVTVANTGFKTRVVEEWARRARWMYGFKSARLQKQLRSQHPTPLLTTPPPKLLL